MGYEAALAKLTQRNDELRSTLKAYLATIKRLEAKVADREASKAEAEVEVAELKALSCQTCDNGDTVAGDDSPNNTYCGLHSTWWDHDAYCSFWTARAEEAKP